MNILVKTIGAGIFSKFMVAIQSILDEVDDVDNISNIYIEVDEIRESSLLPHLKFKYSCNPFDFVIDQKIIKNPDKIIMAYPNAVLKHDNLFNTEKLRKLRVIISKIKLKDIVLDRINNEIDESTLGVHVRLTDMANHHPDLHGGSTTNDYVNKINEILLSNKGNKIFVSSDNEESLSILKENFPDIINNSVTNRNDTELAGDYLNYMIRQMDTESFWVDSFLDMISISKCGSLVYKTSNLNISSLIFSKTIKKSYII